MSGELTPELITDAHQPLARKARCLFPLRLAASDVHNTTSNQMHSALLASSRDGKRRWGDARLE